MPALKRCPFCGDIVGYFGYDDKTMLCEVRCISCNARITRYHAAPEKAKQRAEEAWNLRTPDAEPTESPHA